MQPRSRFRTSLKVLGGLAVGVTLGVVIAWLGDKAFGDPTFEPKTSELKEKLGIWLLPLALLMSTLMGIFAIAVHELGHVIGGLMGRMRFHFYVVGPLRIERSDHDRIRVTLNRDVGFAGGAVAMLPTDTNDLPRRFFLLIAGGPLASLLLALAAYASGSALLRILGMLSAVIFIATILPMQTGGLMTDGRRMLRLLGKGVTAEREAAMLPLVAAWSSGTPPREWSRALIDTALKDVDGGVDEYNARIFAYFHFLDAGDVETARVHVMRALDVVDDLPAAFRGSIELEAAYFIARYDRDATRARELFSKVPKRGLGITEYERARTEAAILLQEGNRAEALRVARSGLAAAPTRNPFARGRLLEIEAHSL